MYVCNVCMYVCMYLCMYVCMMYVNVLPYHSLVVRPIARVQYLHAELQLAKPSRNVITGHPIHIYIHTYIHTYIHMYIHKRTLLQRDSPCKTSRMPGYARIRWIDRSAYPNPTPKNTLVNNLKHLCYSLLLRPNLPPSSW